MVGDFQQILKYTDADLIDLRQGQPSRRLYTRLEDEVRILTAKIAGLLVLESVFLYVTIRIVSCVALWSAFNLLVVIWALVELRRKQLDLRECQVEWVKDQFWPKLGFGRWYLVGSEEDRYHISQDQYVKLAKGWENIQLYTLYYWPHSRQVVALECEEKPKRD